MTLYLLLGLSEEEERWNCEPSLYLGWGKLIPAGRSRVEAVTM